MGTPKLTEKIFSTMGTSTKCGIVVMSAIALFKGILRPIFALQDKKSDPQTRKYTAMREGLTEVAALPLYATLPIGAGWLAGKIFKNHKAVHNIKLNTSFAVLGLATMAVPVICNKIQAPIMNAYKNRVEAKKAKLTPLNYQSTYKYNSGMKVGS
ncbi:MAG: hypothetical protein LKG27_02340 [Clostridiaceae bacterium]|jgi:spore maturation protein SpmA|nr:hypothetical protein [Clostridiaceae bacterium]